MDMASTLYLRLKDDYLYFIDAGKKLFAAALEAVLTDLEQEDELAIDNGRAVFSVRKAISQFKKVASVLHRQNAVQASMQEGLKVTFLMAYLPKPLAEIEINQLVLTIMHRYQVDSLSFFPLVLRDVLSSIVSEELTDEVVQQITSAVRMQFLQYLRKRCVQQDQDLPAVVIERKKHTAQNGLLQERVYLFNRDYSNWNRGRMLKPTPC